MTGSVEGSVGCSAGFFVSGGSVTISVASVAFSADITVVSVITGYSSTVSWSGVAISSGVATLFLGAVIPYTDTPTIVSINTTENKIFIRVTLKFCPLSNLYSLSCEYTSICSSLIFPILRHDHKPIKIIPIRIILMIIKTIIILSSPKVMFLSYSPQLLCDRHRRILRQALRNQSWSSGEIKYFHFFVLSFSFLHFSITLCGNP